MATTIEQQKEKFQQALALRGRSVTIKHENAQQAEHYDPTAGAYPDPFEEKKYVVGAIPFSDEGKAQLAARSDGRFLLDPAYEAYSIEAGVYVPIVGDVLLFDGIPMTVVVVDATVIDKQPIHYQIGLRNG